MTTDWMPVPGYGHWCRQYLWDRFLLGVYELTHPGYPWLVSHAIEVFDATLKKSDRALEFGSGRSTLWFARRVGQLTSVEHDAAWHARVRGKLDRAGATHVNYLLRPEDEADEESPTAAYVRTLDLFEPESLDFVLVDGIYRPACAMGAIEKLRPGGLLAVDNINWFLPCGSRAPNSLKASDPPRSGAWGRFAERVRGWKVDWSTNGVTDTGIFYKPTSDAVGR